MVLKFLVDLNMRNENSRRLFIEVNNRPDSATIVTILNHENQKITLITVQTISLSLAASTFPTIFAWSIGSLIANENNMKSKLLLFSFFIPSTFLFAQTAYVDTAFTEYFRRTSGWTGGDATLSILLPDGRTMWLFGDSYIDNYKSNDNSLPCLFQVRNSLMVSEADDPNQMTTYIDYTKTGIERTYFKIGTVGNSVYWPGHGFVKKDTVFVFLEKYNGTNYTFLGNYIAKILLPNFELMSINPLPAMSGLNMGKAVLFDEASGYYYIYGNKLNWIVYEPYVARTKFKNLQSGNWKFYNGSNWVSNPANAKKISNDPGVSWLQRD
jgi:hypothetical protein